MAISFPSSPVVDQAYVYLERTWIWNGSGWAQPATPSAFRQLFIGRGYTLDTQNLGLVTFDIT